MTNGLPLRRLFSSLDVRDCDNSTRKCRWRANRHSTIPLEDKAAKIGESRGTEASEVNYSNPAEVMAFKRAETVWPLEYPANRRSTSGWYGRAAGSGIDQHRPSAHTRARWLGQT